MDIFLDKVQRLSDLAAGRADPAPLDAGGVMARIRGVEVEDETLALPLGFFAGGAAAAAAAAVVVSFFALSAWTDLSSPVLAMDSLLDVMDIML